MQLYVKSLNGRFNNQKQWPQTSLWEELRVDFFESFFVDNSAGTFLQEKVQQSVVIFIEALFWDASVNHGLILTTNRQVKEETKSH